MAFRSPQTLLFRRYDLISITTSKFDEKGCLSKNSYFLTIFN